MSNTPIKDFSIGKCKGTVWQGEYNGKPTYSVSFQKSYKDQQGNWKNTNFFNLTEIRDLYVLVGFMLNKQVKEFDKTKQQPKLSKEQFNNEFPDLSQDENNNQDVSF